MKLTNVMIYQPHKLTLKSLSWRLDCVFFGPTITFGALIFPSSELRYWVVKKKKTSQSFPINPFQRCKHVAIKNLFDFYMHLFDQIQHVSNITPLTLMSHLIIVFYSYTFNTIPSREGQTMYQLPLKISERLEELPQTPNLRSPIISTGNILLL